MCFYIFEIVSGRDFALNHFVKSEEYEGGDIFFFRYGKENFHMI